MPYHLREDINIITINNTIQVILTMIKYALPYLNLVLQVPWDVLLCKFVQQQGFHYDH